MYSFDHEVIIKYTPPSDYVIGVRRRKIFLEERKEWCRRNVSTGAWRVTPFTTSTFIFKFASSEDALAFRLRFEHV